MKMRDPDSGSISTGVKIIAGVTEHRAGPGSAGPGGPGRRIDPKKLPKFEALL
jgi:hypothetical protein